MPDKMLLTTTTLDPDRFDIVANFDKKFAETLPKDYTDFLKKYGSGIYCDDIIISYPDKEIIPITFRDHSDLWKFNNSYTKEDLLSSIQIGWTVDGDIIGVTAGKEGRIFVLPRHSETISLFSLFFDAVEYLMPQKKSILYFDPLFDAEQEQINLIRSSSLIDIWPIYRNFLERFEYDFVVNENIQPKYIIHAIGGWVYFDLIYKNSISIKFQKQHIDKVQPIFDFLKQQVK